MTTADLARWYMRRRAVSQREAIGLAEQVVIRHHEKNFQLTNELPGLPKTVKAPDLRPVR